MWEDKNRIHYSYAKLITIRTQTIAKLGSTIRDITITELNQKNRKHWGYASES